MTFNAEASDRIIAACITHEDADTISGVTIGGVTAGLLKDENDTNRRTAIWSAAVPSGTTGDVVITMTSGDAILLVGTFSITGADATPTDTDSAGGSAASISITALTIPTDGAGLAVFCNSNFSATVTWTGAAESYDETVSPGSHRSSAAIITTVGTNTITADSTATANQSLVGVAFGPASGGAATSLPIFSRPSRFMRRRAA